jgi:hypothetical protein
MKLLTVKQNRLWIYGLAASSLIFLLIGLGLGVDTSHGGSPSGNTAAQEPKPTTIAQGLQLCRLGKKTQARGCEHLDDPDRKSARRAERFWAERSVWRSFPSRTIQAEESRLRLHR